MGERDDRGRAPRWGSFLSRDEAEALSRRWREGDIISEPERFRRLQAWILEQVGDQIAARGYGHLNQVRSWMAEQGLTELTEEADPNLVQQIVCEEVCLAEVAARNLKGPDLDSAYWSCMQQCSPVIYPETLDPTDPLYPHSPEPDPEEFTTTFSFPERTTKP